MTTPEKPAENESKNFTEKWWEKWLQLFGNLLGVKDLEKTIGALAKEKDAGKVKKALLNLGSEENTEKKENFVRKLTGLLLNKEDPNSQAEIDRLLESVLETRTDDVSRKMVDGFKRAGIGKQEDADEFESARKEVGLKKDAILAAEQEKLRKVKIVDDAEIDELRQQIGIEIDTPKQLNEIEKEKILNQFWLEKEKELIVEETTAKLKKPSLIDSAHRVELRSAKEIFDRIVGSNVKVVLSEGESKILDGFLMRHLNEEDVNLILDVMEKKLETDHFLKLLSSIRKGFGREESSVPAGARGLAELSRVNPGLVDLITGRVKRNNKSLSEFNENDFNELRVSGMLNINPERYAEFNTLIEKELRLNNALVVDKDRKTAKMSDKLTKEDKERVNNFFRKKLISEVRMMVDESVQINNSNIDARATEYVTMMSIMGLSTTMKSDVMNSARRMTFAFMVFNSPQTEEGYRQLCEYAAQIGSEYSIFSNVMKMREKISVKLEGKEEVELTDLSQIDFVNVASQAILDPVDRAHYGITKSVEEVGRTYADMMMASSRRDEKLNDWIPVTRKALKERMGEKGYEDMLRKIKAIDRRGNPIFDNEEDKANGLTLEKKYLKAIGDKYWDYYNGIYTYYLMTRSSGEFVGNASPNNNELRLPAGLNENFNFKMDPSAWSLFQDMYNVPNFPEIAQLFRFNGNSSLSSKEGNEVLSYLIQTKRDPVGKLATIADAFYEKGRNISEVDLEKLRDVFIGSIFLPDKYHLSGKSATLAKNSHIYEAIPLKMDKKTKLMKLDATAQRRDFASARKLMVDGLTRLNDSNPQIFEGMDFSLLKKEFAHDTVLLKSLEDPSLSGFEKMVKFAERWGEDKQLFENLSNKRPDDFTKYAIDYHKEWQAAANALAAKPTWAAYIKMMAVVERIVGKGEKCDPIAMRGFEYMVELRKARVWNETYVRQIQEGGKLKYDDGNYVGELPGHYPVPDLKAEKVKLSDIQENGGKLPSIVTIAGGKGEVDEEGVEQQMLGAMKMASLITDETYKHERKHLAKSITSWHRDRPFTAELWDTVTGKKYINYLAIEVFDMPPEYFLEMIIGATGDFFSMWWKYLNGTGAGGGHH